MTPLRPSPLKALRAHAFWLAQIIAWTCFAALEVMNYADYAATSGVEPDFGEATLKALIPATLGLAVTSGAHAVLRRRRADTEAAFIATAIGLWLAGSAAFAIGHIEAKIAFGYHAAEPFTAWRSWLRNWPSKVVLLGGWTSVYVALTFARETARQRARLRELEATATRARSDMLRHQVNPHLLFNTLNTISAHVLNRDLGQADVAIQRLSDLLRANLSDADAACVTVEQEIERARLYLEVERTRFGDVLDVAINVPPELRAARVPPLLLQPLVENAMKHGVARCVDGGRITLSASRDGDRVRLEVRDELNGPRAELSRPQTPESFGLGLRNVRERLALHFNGEAALEVVAHEPTRFVVRLTFPERTEARADD